MAALAEQRFGRERFEVVVVDDASDSSLEPAVAPFRDAMHVQLVVLEKNGGPARARNIGASRASGAMLAFTDDDCEPSPDWLSTLHARFLHDKESAYGGHTINALPDNPYSAASQLLIDYLYDYYSRTAAAADGPAAPPFFTSNNLAISADLFRAVGGFDESFPLAAGEDRELCDRWQHHGYRLQHVTEAVIRHAHVLTLRKYWRQHSNYGRGAYHLRRAREAQGRSAPKREPLSFYMDLILFPITRGEPRKLRLSALMFLSQVANVLGFVREARRTTR